ncbi:MAG: hypothetical protein QOI34_625 [Verrucomicrobiota bacterium]|jgi:uncharacterized membrane protein YdjX (TVP38/TMEM64 family)
MWQRGRSLNLKVAALAIAVALLLLLSHFFSMVEVMTAMQQRVMRWGAWSAVCYPLLFALCNLLLLPGGILCVGSGFFFGLWWGFFIVLTGNIIAAAAAFAISRSVGRDWFREKLLRHPTLRALEPAVEREGWKIIVLSQLHPFFPTSLLNYLYGLTRIRFRTYMIWVTIGRMPGLFLYSYLGTLGQFGLNLVHGKTHPRVVEYWIWGGAFLVSAILLMIFSRIAVRTIERAQRADSRARGTVSEKRAREKSTR